MRCHKSLLIATSLLFLSSSNRTSIAADPKPARDLQAALTEFREQSASVRERSRIQVGAVVFKEYFTPKFSGRGLHGALLYDSGQDARLDWQEVVKLLGRPDSVYQCPIESQHKSFDRPDDIDKALSKKELPFLETAFWYRLGNDSVGQHALFLVFENGILRKVKLTMSTR